MRHPKTGGTARVARRAWEQVWSKHLDGWQLVEGSAAPEPLVVEEPPPAEDEATDEEDD